MKTVVLGFPRSGTGTMAKRLNLGHEEKNENGISDWHMSMDFIREKEKLIHVMRNPIDVIASNLFTMSAYSLQFIIGMADIEDKSLLSTIIEGFIKWTNAIELLNPDEIILIEDIEEIHNARKHPKMKWSDLDVVPLELRNNIKEIAIKYGYDPND